MWDTMKASLVFFTALTVKVCLSSAVWKDQTTLVYNSLDQPQSKWISSAAKHADSKDNEIMSSETEKHRTESLSILEEQGLSPSVEGGKYGAGNDSQSVHQFGRPRRSPADSSRSLRIKLEDTQRGQSTLATRTSRTILMTTGQKYNQRAAQNTQMTYSFSPKTQWSNYFTTSPTTKSRSGRDKWLNPSNFCNNMVSFVEKHDLCNQTTTLKPSRSCHDRCGRIGVWSELCSCDELCSTYGDCCMDFSVVCPATFTRSQNITKHDALIECYQGYKMVQSCPDISYNSGSVTSFTTLPTVTWTPPAGSTPREFQSGLKFHALNFNSVADLVTGLVYSSEGVYLCNRDQHSVPYLIPYVLSLSGVYETGRSIESYVFSDLTPSYYSPHQSASSAIKMRACVTSDYLMCWPCPIDTIHFIYRDNFCEALASGNATEVLDKKWIPDNDRGVINVVRTCVHGQGLQTHVGKNEQQASVTIRKVSLLTTEYLLEFEGAPWRRLRCSSPTLRLDDCDIDECSAGFWPGHKGGCFKPNIITVEFSETTSTPICSCLMAYTAIAMTEIWGLSKMNHRNETCQIHTQDDPVVFDRKRTRGNGDDRNTGHNAAREMLRNELLQKLSQCDDILHSTITLWFGKVTPSEEDYVYANFSIALEEPTRTTLDVNSNTMASGHLAPLSGSVSTVQRSFKYITMLAVSLAIHTDIKGFL